MVGWSLFSLYLYIYTHSTSNFILFFLSWQEHYHEATAVCYTTRSCSSDSEARDQVSGPAVLTGRKIRRLSCSKRQSRSSYWSQRCRCRSRRRWAACWRVPRPSRGDLQLPCGRWVETWQASQYRTRYRTREALRRRRGEVHPLPGSN